MALVMALEVAQSTLDHPQVRQVVGSQHLALGDGQVNLDLIEPRGVDRTVDEVQVEPRSRVRCHAAEGCRLVRVDEDLPSLIAAHEMLEGEDVEKSPIDACATRSSLPARSTSPELARCRSRKGAEFHRGADGLQLRPHQDGSPRTSGTGNGSRDRRHMGVYRQVLGDEHRLQRRRGTNRPTNLPTVLSWEWRQAIQRWSLVSPRSGYSPESWPCSIFDPGLQLSAATDARLEPSRGSSLSTETSILTQSSSRRAPDSREGVLRRAPCTSTTKFWCQYPTSRVPAMIGLS